MIPQLALILTILGAGPAQPATHHVAAPLIKVVHHTAQPATGAYGLYDSADPAGIPKGKIQALYATGSYTGSAADVKGHPRTLWVDVTGGDPHADVLDIEDSDSHWWQAGPWAAEAHKDHPNRPVIIYTAYGTWKYAQESVAAYHVKVKWWVASPSGTPHMVPGADAVQWMWGKTYDISLTMPGFWTP